MRLYIAALLLLCCANAPASSGVPASGAELKFREQMDLTGYQRVEYQDEKGKQLTFEQFQKLLPNRSFGMEKRKNGTQSSAVVRLEAATAKMVLPKYRLAAGAGFPAFKLRAMDGSMVDNAALIGRYTVVNFYFGDCVPCIKEVPMLNEFAARNKDFDVLAITFDSKDEARKFVKRTNFNWRTVADAGELLDQVGVKVYPSFALLDPKGVVVAITNGVEASTHGWDLDKWVAKTIAARAQ
ncbi:TlpA family protein disulfide reductase [Pseudoduganella sp. OTU4001]|uniref:TlpA family protein disulfide reductase n=1 Tax=Pseudoduganella sp. OTU4001 TaxID=3043854 RepID=UPI00313D98F7